MPDKKIILKNPFDAHMHWRQKSTLLNKVATYSIDQFSGGLLMPNTDPKIIDAGDLVWYRDEIFSEIGERDFYPIFTFYLSEKLPIHHLKNSWGSEKKLFHAVKYYPKGGTTGSDKGLKGFGEVMHLLEEMQKLDIPLLIHGETPDMDGEIVDDFEREQIFMETELVHLREQFPNLRIVLEHITTKMAAQFVLDHENTWATITPQHCLFDRRALFNGATANAEGFKFDLNKNGSYPSLVCRPILKHKTEVEGIQDALRFQAKNGLKKFGLGTDTAPHLEGKKYCECGACGVFSAPIALELYAMAFEAIGILDHLPVFACDVMPEFYNIKDSLPEKSISLEKRSFEVLNNYSGIVTPFAGQKIPWTASEIL